MHPDPAGPSTLIIAEVGINHNGDFDLAAQAVSAAAEAGADVAKFHTYQADRVMMADTPLAQYMSEGLSGVDDRPTTFLEMATQYELSHTANVDLLAHCESVGIEFLSSPFDEPSVEYLRGLGLERLKIPSGELVNPLMLRAAAASGLPLIVSTGMSDLTEVEWAVNELSNHDSGPVTLLHCLSQYPAEFKFVNLQAITTLRREFGLPVGFSDHTPGIEASVAAVALGATVIEKHITLDRTLPGPDQDASLTPAEFQDLVSSIRNVEAAIGSGVKEPAPPEVANAAIVRKSVVLTHPSPAGTILTADHLAVKRPGTGIPAREIDRVLGRRLARSVDQESLLSWNDLEPVGVD